MTVIIKSLIAEFIEIYPSNEKGHKIIAEAIKEHIEKRKIKLIG